MDDTIKTLMHQRMTDRQYQRVAQEAMMYGHKMNRMSIVRFAQFKQREVIEEASPADLYILLSLFYETTHSSIYDPKKYFNDEELSKFAEMNRDISEQRFPITTKLSEDEYLILLPWKELVSIVTQILEEQRDVAWNGGRIIRPFTLGMFQRHVEEEGFQTSPWFNCDPSMHCIKIDGQELIITHGLANDALLISEFDFLYLLNSYLTGTRRHNSLLRVDQLVPVRITQFSKDRLKKTFSLRKIKKGKFQSCLPSVVEGG